MMSYIPITLVGKNLGERHRELNNLVSDAYQKKVPFETLRNVEEQSAVDRLFKIDLASKHRHLEYVLANLRDDDMLYVSRALRSIWLLEPQYRDVINPAHLENNLYPDMSTTAVNKMNNWLHVHLKDSNRCLEFFQYYSPKNLDLALKFLWNSPEDVIVETVPKILKKITPKRMKLLCEKCPRAVRVYYELLPKNVEVFYEYFKQEELNQLCLTNLINTDSDLFLDIVEKYYDTDCWTSFGSTITRVIMKKHKDRFAKKPELYAAWFLHSPTLAKFLSTDEIKDVVLRLARAEYLGSNYFSYKRVEPLIKRLSKEERITFKRLVFTDKCIGEAVKDWPYVPPLSLDFNWDIGRHVFDDKIFVPGKSCLGSDLRYEQCSGRGMTRLLRNETLLDKLFNKYRCISFKTTFMELNRKIQAESSVQAREYMMLVLVSKTGGHKENLKDLLGLLVERHNNEADNFRATIVRSLVKRAKVWQLPSDLWQKFVKFAHGLGLDGEQTDENCDEGLHAVVVRSILLAEPFSPKVFSAYINKFSTFGEYALNEDEKRKVADKLPQMLLSSAKEQTKTNEIVKRLETVMRVLNDYNLKITQYSDFIPIISAIALKDPEPCVNLLKQLYKARLARKELYRENFTFLQSNESYLNVLRHEYGLLKDTAKFEKLLSEEIEHDPFLRKLSIYFSESEGLAAAYLNKVETEMARNPRPDLSRSFAILAGTSLFKKVQEVDGIPEKTTEQKQLAVALRTYGHLARPKLNLSSLGWRVAGVKAVANQISTCSASKVDEHIQALSQWPCAVRLTFALAEKIGREAAIFPLITRIRPTVAVKITLRYMKQRGEESDPKVWLIARPLFYNIDLSQPKHGPLRDRLRKLRLSKVPESLRADYGEVVYRALNRVSPDEAMRILVNMEDYFPNVDEGFFVDVIQEFLDNELTLEKSLKARHPHNNHRYLIMRMIAKYLLLCKSEEMQKRRMETIGKQFLRVMKTFLDEASNDLEEQVFRNYWDNFMYALKYTEVFFDTSYISPLPVMQQIVEWLKEVMPIVKYFDVYVSLNLIAFYFKAIRQSMKQNEQIFLEKAKSNDIGVEIVGVAYGKYIDDEMIRLKKEYFESIVEIYAKVLMKYLAACFHECHTFTAFVSALIRGMLKGGKDSATLMLIQKLFFRYRSSLEDLKSDKSLEILLGIEDKQLKFFLHAQLCD